MSLGINIRGGVFILLLLELSCGGGGQKLINVCGCVPTATNSEDYRHAEKHVPLPDEPQQDITVATVLSWPADSSLIGNGIPRAGRELHLFHISNAYLQAVILVHSDCDIHFEIAGSADKNAPRVIVETPVDPEYCPTRQAIQSQLANHGIYFANQQPGGPPMEVTPAIPADVVGLAFQDDSHRNRGSALVKTIWELHPAIVRLTQ